MVSVNLDFRLVSDGLPPAGSYNSDYSVECAVIVKGEMFDRAVMHSYSEHGWLWADQAIGNNADHYLEELGGDCTPTHWALWPTSLAIEC